MNIDLQKVPSPCYVLDKQKFTKNLETIKYVADQAGIEIILALKGFAMWSMFPYMRNFIHGASASSLYEARLIAEEFNVKVHTYSPAYTDAEIHEILLYSDCITFNSFSQLDKYKSLLAGKSVGIRVNPGYSDVITDLYNPAMPNSRLGVGIGNFPERLPEFVEGIHFHSLCESDSYSLEKLLDSFMERFGKYLSHIKWVNMGGGHLMTREGYDITHLIKILKQFKETYNVDIILEPGSAFAWETGYLVSTIQDIVENGNVKTAILDVSFTCHMPDCLEMPYQPTILDAEKGDAGKYVYRFGGNSCLAGDFMESWSFNKELKIGDRVVFDDMIHYTMVKTTMFNGVSHPSIGIWNENSEFQLIRQFDYSDYRNRLS